MSRSTKPVVAITVGDFNGIGPEVTLKSIRHPAVVKRCRPLLVGPAEVFTFYAKKLRIPLNLHPFDADERAKNSVPFLQSSSIRTSTIRPGELSVDAGLAAVKALELAVQTIQQGVANAMVTSPVSKQALHLAGADYPGQTEMLQHLSGSPRVAMMLVSERMRVGLVTIHIPISKVSEMISRQALREKIGIIFDALRHDWKIRSPKLAVLALNPHASEGGDIGDEDITVVAPVVNELRKSGMHIEGPFPADAFFGNFRPHRYDAVVAMYHDQGLIPLKMASFGTAVNISVGLNIVRTSPDHGTAFDIAGKGIANPGSMIEAITLAALLANNRVSRKKS
jgi:4-hydroxythreonine-4-phosphate dehydrogenase